VHGQYVYVSKLCHRTIGYVRSSVTEPKATFTVRLSKDLHGNTVAPLFHSQGDYTAKSKPAGTMPSQGARVDVQAASDSRLSKILDGETPFVVGRVGEGKLVDNDGKVRELARFMGPDGPKCA
jgi:hypothetical protein